MPGKTWPEVREALAQVKAALVAVGSFKQHGPGGTFEVDSARADGFGKLLAARLYLQLVLSRIVNIGVSYHHMKLPGSITLRPGTFMAVVYDVVWSLRQHGVKKFLILNSHGGNAALLGVLVVKLREQLGGKAAWTGFTSLAKEDLEERVKIRPSGHGCQGEMSQAMVLASHTVRQEAFEPSGFKGFPYRHLGQAASLEYPSCFDEITSNGTKGDPIGANEELGWEIIETALKYTGGSPERTLSC